MCRCSVCPTQQSHAYVQTVPDSEHWIDDVGTPFDQLSTIRVTCHMAKKVINNHSSLCCNKMSKQSADLQTTLFTSELDLVQLFTCGFSLNTHETEKQPTTNWATTESVDWSKFIHPYVCCHHSAFITLYKDSPLESITIHPLLDCHDTLVSWCLSLSPA